MTAIAYMELALNTPVKIPVKGNTTTFTTRGNNAGSCESITREGDTVTVVCRGMSLEIPWASCAHGVRIGHVDGQGAVSSSRVVEDKHAPPPAVVEDEEPAALVPQGGSRVVEDDDDPTRDAPAPKKPRKSRAKKK